MPVTDTTMVDYPYAWAGIYHRRLVDRGLLHFHDGLRTAEDRPGSGAAPQGRVLRRRQPARRLLPPGVTPR